MEYFSVLIPLLEIIEPDNSLELGQTSFYVRLNISLLIGDVKQYYIKASRTKPSKRFLLNKLYISHFDKLVEENRLDLIYQLFSKFSSGRYPKRRITLGNYLLISAIKYNNEDLINYGINLTITTKDDFGLRCNNWNKSLRQAIICKNFELAKILIPKKIYRRNIDIDILELICRFGNLDLLKLIYPFHLVLSDTMFHNAIVSNQKDILEYLKSQPYFERKIDNLHFFDRGINRIIKNNNIQLLNKYIEAGCEIKFVNLKLKEYQQKKKENK